MARVTINLSRPFLIFHEKIPHYCRHEMKTVLSAVTTYTDQQFCFYSLEGVKEIIRLHLQGANSVTLSYVLTFYINYYKELSDIQ